MKKVIYLLIISVIVKLFTSFVFADVIDEKVERASILRISVKGVKQDDHGNDFITATQINTDNKDNAGKIENQGDSDFFKAELSENLKTSPQVVFRLSGLSPEINPVLSVYDGNKVLIGKADSESGYIFEVDNKNKDNIFYVSVKSKDTDKSKGIYYLSAGTEIASDKAGYYAPNNKEQELEEEEQQDEENPADTDNKPDSYSDSAAYSEELNGNTESNLLADNTENSIDTKNNQSNSHTADLTDTKQQEIKAVYYPRTYLTAALPNQELNIESDMEPAEQPSSKQFSVYQDSGVNTQEFKKSVLTPPLTGEKEINGAGISEKPRSFESSSQIKNQ